MSNDKILYDNIGTGYNATRQADPSVTERLYELLSPKADGLYLDIGCGTGNYTIALANKGLSFYGIEPSEEMLRIARSRDSNIYWLTGMAESIPINNNTFDGSIATLTIHHWMDLEESLNEIYRVLKPGARLVIFSATPNQMQGYWLNYYFPKMMESSIRQMPSFEKIETALNTTGFVGINRSLYEIPDDLQDCFLYVGKNRPRLYLDEKIRKGISSFSALANEKEVKQGLAKLYRDIVLNQFAAVQAKYANNRGDYLFITAQK